MLKHDLTIALRRLLQRRFYTGIGVVVLTLGLVCFIATNLFVSYIRHYDRHWPNADRIYVVAERMRAADFGFSPAFDAGSDAPIADHLRVDAPELAAVARVRTQGAQLLAVGEQRLPLTVAYAESDFAEIFELTPLAGEIGEALATPRSVVLTQRAAERLFGTFDVAGRTVTLVAQPLVDVTIRAVIADFPNQSHLNMRSIFARGYDVFVSWDVLETFERSQLMGWGGNAVTTYALLPADGSLTAKELDRRLARIAAERVPEDYRFLDIALEARPVSTIAAMGLQKQFQGHWGTGVWIDVLAALRAGGAAILALACLNFVNLAIAQASGRTVDVGTRKVLGATTLQIVRQDLLQSSVVVVLALLLALAAIVPLSQLLAASWSLSLELPWKEPRFFAFLGGTLVGVVLAAGLYPAFGLARARRAAALRIGFASDTLAWVRSGLVGLQFAAASALVVAAIVLLLQRNELHDALVGRFADQYVAFVTAPTNSDALAVELLRGPGIEGVTSTNGTPFQNQQRRFTRTLDASSSPVMLDFISTGYDYFAVMDVPVVAGRAFERDRADDTQQADGQSRPRSLVLDRTAARALGWPDPASALGEIVYAPIGVPPGGLPHEIVGIVEHTPTSVRANNASGTAYVFAPGTRNFRIVRVAPDQVEAALAHIDETTKSLFPEQPPPYKMFFDRLFEAAYSTFELTSRVLTGLAVFALAISGIGLFGMASYMANRRTREIGVRKVQGATPGSIQRLLLWDFSKPVVWANLVAWPFVLLAIDRYLSLFAERVAITPLPFVLALVATWLLACLAVGFCARRAAKLHPAEALRQ
jgi:putative ABC transport system permease protein